MSELFSFIFGAAKKVDPQEQFKTWKRTIKQQISKVDREIKQNERDEAKALSEIRNYIKLGQMQAAKNYTKHLCDFRKCVKKQYLARTTLNSLQNQLQIAAAHLKVANIIQSSTDIMHSLNSTLKLDSISSTMAEMGKEMMKAGLIEEIISDGMSDIAEVDTSDEEVNLELEKIMNDVALSTTMTAAGGAYVPVRSNIAASTPVRTGEVASTASPDDEVYQQMRARLDGL